jgi:hypothetical protein
VSEYDPILPLAPATTGGDLERVQELFENASRPYLASPWSWAAWALLLPGAALATPATLARFGGAGVLFLWSAAILLGGAVEMAPLWRRGRATATPLAAWALRVQGNLSLVAAALSAVLVAFDAAWLLPGLWLLLLGHSLYLLGGLAFAPFRRCGLLYQGAGLLALWPRLPSLLLFAAAVAAGNLYLAASVWREQRGRRRTGEDEAGVSDAARSTSRSADR